MSPWMNSKTLNTRFSNPSTSPKKRWKHKIIFNFCHLEMFAFDTKSMVNLEDMDCTQPEPNAFSF